MHSPPCARSRGGLTYWALHFREACFYSPGLRFSDYAPAIYLGISEFIASPTTPFEYLLPQLRAQYKSVRGNSSLPWEGALPVIWAAWERVRVETRRLH